MGLKRAVTVLLIIFLILALSAAALIFARPTIEDMQREKAHEAVLERVEAGESDVSDIYVPQINDGGYDAPYEESDAGAEAAADDAQTDAGGANAAAQDKTAAIGTIEIPSIAQKMALMLGATKTTLGYGAGWMETSAAPGAPGNCVVLGHRMKAYGRDFNRLDELRAGDTINVSLISGEKYTYIVTGTAVIEPEALAAELGARNGGYNITLVTCTPVGVGSQRLLVTGELIQ